MKIRQMILMLIDLLFFAPLALQSSVDGFQPQSSVEPSKLQRVDMGWSVSSINLEYISHQVGPS